MEMVGDGRQIICHSWAFMQGGEVKHVFAIMGDHSTYPDAEISDVFFSLKLLVGLFGEGDCHISLVTGS